MYILNHSKKHHKCWQSQLSHHSYNHHNTCQQAWPISSTFQPTQTLAHPASRSSKEQIIQDQQPDSLSRLIKPPDVTWGGLYTLGEPPAHHRTIAWTPRTIVRYKPGSQKYIQIRQESILNLLDIMLPARVYMHNCCLPVGLYQTRASKHAMKCSFWHTTNQLCIAAPAYLCIAWWSTCSTPITPLNTTHNLVHIRAVRVAQCTKSSRHKAGSHLLGLCTKLDLLRSRSLLLLKSVGHFHILAPPEGLKLEVLEGGGHTPQPLHSITDTVRICNIVLYCCIVAYCYITM